MNTFKVVLPFILPILFVSINTIAESKGAAKKGKAKVEYKLVPGKSLGEAVIGDSIATLQKKGFKEDPDMGAGRMFKGPVFVHIDDGVASEIWFDGNIAKVTYKGKAFPSSKDVKVIAAMFSKCQKPIKGSGGELIYCEDQGIQLTTSYPTNEFSLLSVVTPDIVKKRIVSQ